MYKKALIPLMHGAEELETIAIVDILRRAGAEVKLAGADEIILCSRKVRILPDILIEQISPTAEYDAIILPGGISGVKNLIDNTIVRKLVQTHFAKGKLIGAICAAPLALAEFKILNVGSQIACHLSVEQDLTGYKISKEPVVISNNIITSRGAGTSIQFALAIVENLFNTEMKDRVSKEIEYN